MPSIFLREDLRQKVRAIVHRACWRRLEGDEVGAGLLLESELSRLFVDCGPTAPDEATANTWLKEDREEFDRAMLIGELVARRVSAATMSVAPNLMPARVSLTMTTPAAGRERRTDAPAIADLLDDMLEQDRRTRKAV